MKSAVLGVALAVSILVNVALLGRRAPEPAAPSPTATKPAAKNDAAAAADVAAELERERALTRELRESVRRLEEEKAVLAQAATAPGAPAAAVAAKPSLREKLRRMKKVFKAAEAGDQPDQEAMLEMSGELMEIFRLGLTRGKDPQTYADFIQACAEIGLEDEAPLTPDQALRMSSILKEMAGELVRIAAGSGVERLIRELEIESAAMERVRGLFTPAQKAVSDRSGLDDMAMMSSGMSTTYLQKGNAADAIVKAWTQAYQLRPDQLAAARAAAEGYARELEAMEKKSVQAGGSYDARLASLRAQLRAVNSFEGSLTAAQRDRLRDQAPREFHFLELPVSLQEEK